MPPRSRMGKLRSTTMLKKRFVAVLASVTLLLSSNAGGAQPFRGNTRSHVFHQSSCRYYSCPNCTARFSSAREAIENGYRPCGICDPAGKPRETARIGAAFVGNTKSHKFHRASCRYAGCANCNAKFNSRQEAIGAGYVPGGCCNP